MPIQKWATAAAIMVASVALALPVVSQERDSDGTRMQARTVEIGTIHADQLQPPDTQADWRLIRLDEETDVKLTLTVNTENQSADLTLSGATGEELEKRRAGRESATIERTLLAGIYYISVESSDTLSYELSIQ